ncbi:spore coat U domain-containing protein [Phenylobacterium sp. SCN 70-31]|uniref:Csu type fimbrial protein n=1 Tax=Phenylobacterium sp. SCN 70-31 TaxID=1660129 RepID=UPI0025DC327D|nr:spore coat U domain-containing protein [Phenylobacterium sp. SCN 70-31]
MARSWNAASWRRLAIVVGGQVVLAILGGGAAWAQSCTVEVSDGDFGTVNGLAGGTVNTTATLSFACTGLTPVVPVTLCPNIGPGSGGDDGSGGRRLTGPGAPLAFQIYQDAARSQPWGSSSLLAFGEVPTITLIPGLSGRVNTTRTLYGRVTVPATTQPGAYASTFANQNFFWGLNLLTCAGITIGTAIPPPAFTFRVDVAPSCTVSATLLDFGPVGLLSAPVSAQNTVSVRCTPGTPYSVGLGPGLNGSGPTARRLAKGAERVTYGIYKDAAATQPWGEAAQGASAVWSGTGSGATQTYTGYGRAPAQTTPSPGEYVDTVVATITY